MATREAMIPVDPQLAAAYNAAPPQAKQKVQAAMRQALQHAASLRAARLSKKESGLFLTLNRTLPGAQQQRYEELMEKRWEETLTKKEHAELLQLIDALQQLWIERWQAVLDLAKLRKVPPQEMMRQLGVDPEAYG